MTSAAGVRPLTNVRDPRRATQWRIIGRDAVKIAVDQTGWIRVSRSQLVAAGMPQSVDPATLQLFTDGGQVAMTVEGEDRGTCNAIRFYGTALDTPSADARVYWLIWGVAPGRRITTPKPVNPAGMQETFDETVERRDKTIYFAALLNGDAENFFGPLVSTDPANPTIQMLRVQHADPSAATATLKVALQGGTDDPLAPVSHQVSVALNGHAAGTVAFSGMTRGLATFAVPAAWLVDGDNNVAFAAIGGDADISVIESVAITYPHTYVADGSSFVFAAAGHRAVTLTGFASADVRVLDVTDPERPVELSSSTAGGATKFVSPSKGTRTLIAVSGGAFASPASVTSNQPFSMEASSGGDLVVIAHPDFVSALDPLVALRRTQGHTVVVATTTQIYDAFEFGVRDPEAIRQFLFYAFRHWRVRPKAVLLVGDASFDPRNYLGLGDFDFVPTKLIGASALETASDAWLTDFDEDGTADIAIGRLPVRSATEAALEAGKIIAYEDAPAGQPWSKSALFVTDFDPNIGFAAHTSAVESAVPGSYTIQTIDAGSSGIVAAHSQLESAFDEGSILVDYVGHGSVERWSSGGGLFNGADAEARANGTKLPIVIAITCLNGYFHDIYIESLAETLLRATNGGAVAVWASSSLTNFDMQVAPHGAFVSTLFDAGATLGDAALAAQRAAADPDVRRTFLLFGDPSMRIKR